MPYGVDKNLGGDTKTNDKWMEDCVSSIMKKGKDKGSAIAICKTVMKNKHKDKNAEFVLDPATVEAISKLF